MLVGDPWEGTSWGGEDWRGNDENCWGTGILQPHTSTIFRDAQVGLVDVEKIEVGDKEDY